MAIDHHEARPLILTLGLDEESQQHFDSLRQQHFPPERNVLAAHLTLFHHLPGAVSRGIETYLSELAKATPPFLLEVVGPRSLGRGVAYDLRCPRLVVFRQRLAHGWDAWLTPQDRQKLQPHVTVQNKVAPETARALLDALRRDFVPFTVLGERLLLWRYLGGPWEPVATFALSGSDPAPLPGDGS